MKPRKMRPKKIPASDPNRAYRFYRELFDFPVNTDKNLVIDKQTIDFYSSDENIQIEILVRDYQEQLEQHFKNYFVTIENIEYLRKNKVTYTIKDSEQNTILIEANKS